MDNYVVTISRQFGSLGRPIAKRMAELLGIEYFDRYIIGKAATKLEVDASEVDQVEETAQEKYRKMRFMFATETTKWQDAVFEAEKQVILDLAEQKNCIIVGRCSDYILRNFKNHVSIYIYAPYYERLKNCVDTLKMQPDAAKLTIDEVDDARENYYLHYAGCHIADPSLKEIMIDSSLLGMEGTAEYLAILIRRVFHLTGEHTETVELENVSEDPQQV